MKILFTDTVYRNRKKIPLAMRERIIESIHKNASHPPQYRATQLRNSPFLRMRIGDYRVIFVIKEDAMIVTKIAHRKDVYRQ